MDKYILVKIKDAGLSRRYVTGVGKVRKAIHTVAEEEGINVADIVSPSFSVTDEESKALEKIFTDVMDRAKKVGMEVRSEHPYAFRSGEWALVTKLVRVSVLGDLMCWEVKFPDGVEDLWAVEDKMADYEFRESVIKDKTAFKLVKDGEVWDYSDLREYMEALRNKILREEPEAQVEILPCTRDEMTAWKER
jgi:hypothetical protein